MRFSVWPAPTQSFADVLEIARHAESTGWDGLWYADHFMPDGDEHARALARGLDHARGAGRVGAAHPHRPARHRQHLPPSGGAREDGRDRRPPVSGGRLVLGLGAGWQENEHRQYGIPFYTVKERLERLAEACELIKSLFANETTTLPRQALHARERGARAQARAEAAAAPDRRRRREGDAAHRRAASPTSGTCGATSRRCGARWRSSTATARSSAGHRARSSAPRSRCSFLTDDRALVERMKSRPIGRPTIVGNADEVREIVRAYREAGVDELIVPDFTLGPREQKLATLDRFIREVATPLR